MALLTDLSDILVTASSLFRAGGDPSTSTGVPIWLGQFPPDTAATAVAIYESGGAGPLNTLVSASTTTTPPFVRRPSVQVISRSTSYPTARALAEVIWTSFHGTLSATSTSGPVYLTISPNQDPIDMGLDPDHRHMISCNFTLQVAP
jgi:hypothetical protein